MDCAEVREALLEAACGLVEGERAGNLRDHFEGCPACRSAWERAREIRSSWKTCGSVEPSPDLHGRVLRRLRRRIVLLPAAGWAAAILLGVLTALFIRGRDTDFAEGSFRIASGADWRLGSGRERVGAGTSIEATPNGNARISLQGRSWVELNPGARVRIVASGEAEGILLDQALGEAHFRVRPGSGPFQVDTPAGTVRVRGTEFSIRIVKEEEMKGKTAAGGTVLAALVGVATGLVAVTTPQGEVEAGAGQTAVLAPGEPPRLSDAGVEPALASLATEEKALLDELRDAAKLNEELALKEKETPPPPPPAGKDEKVPDMRAMIRAGVQAAAKAYVRVFKEKLNLTEEQVKAITASLGAAYAGFTEAMFKETLSLEDLERLTDFKDSCVSAVVARLTPDQKAKFESEGGEVQPMQVGAGSKEVTDLLARPEIDPATRALLKEELSHCMMGYGILVSRATFADAADESRKLSEEFTARRLKKIEAGVAPSLYPEVEKTVRALEKKVLSSVEQ
jgi:ferric-dicitrate binding protein FerR (iron transport regulator)